MLERQGCGQHRDFGLSRNLEWSSGTFFIWFGALILKHGHLEKAELFLLSWLWPSRVVGHCCSRTCCFFVGHSWSHFLPSVCCTEGGGAEGGNSERGEFWEAGILGRRDSGRFLICGVRVGFSRGLSQTLGGIFLFGVLNQDSWPRKNRKTHTLFLLHCTFVHLN